MSFFNECNECDGTGSIFLGGSTLDENNYDECPACHGKGGYYEDEEEDDADE
ncbi:MAG: hypothetical protein BWY21_00045 [Parcubacteria group bacterium ADurb.Bin216]|nr:MAG: hypothetical protein BWY21_00045 [Parcubacteria group bacterium ADurb.Bin216]